MKEVVSQSRILLLVYKYSIDFIGCVLLIVLRNSVVYKIPTAVQARYGIGMPFFAVWPLQVQQIKKSHIRFASSTKSLVDERGESGSQF